MATLEELEARVAVLEAEVERLKNREKELQQTEVPWWEKIRGTFKDDPIYDEAMALGKAYRESLCPSDTE